MNFNKKFALLFTLIWVFFVSTDGAPQDFKAGVTKKKGCPSYKGKQDLNLAEFLGTWFVGYHFNMNRPPCQALRFAKTGGDTYSIGASILISPNVTLIGAARAYVPNKSNPSLMILKWSYATGYNEEYTVLDSDYKNYAIVAVCATYERTVRTAALILTRDFTVKDIYINRAKTILAPYFDLPEETRTQEECLAPTDPRGVQNINLNVVYSRYEELAPMLQAIRLGSNVTVLP